MFAHVTRSVGSTLWSKHVSDFGEIMGIILKLMLDCVEGNIEADLKFSIVND